MSDQAQSGTNLGPNLPPGFQLQPPPSGGNQSGPSLGSALPPGFVLQPPPQTSGTSHPPDGFVLQPPPAIKSTIDTYADAHGVPRDLAYGILKQESQWGQASPNIGQITQATAANPGYGLAPLPAGQINNPAANIDFSMRYLKAKAAANGATNLSDPKQAAVAAMLYNGGGDPNYVQNVARHMPPGSMQVAQNQPATGMLQTQIDASPMSQQEMPPTGINSPGVQAGLNAYRTGQALILTGDPTLAELGKSYINQAGSLMQLDSFQTTTQNGIKGTVNTRTGEFKPFAYGDDKVLPNGDILNNQNNQIIGHTNPDLVRENNQGLNPVTGQPVGPSNVGSSAAEQAAKSYAEAQQKYLADMPGRINAAAAAAQESLNLNQGAMQAIAQAKQGGIKPGYFAPAIGEAAAAAKGLGLDTSALGVAPDAVTNIQGAKSYLRNVAGQALKQVFGTRITNQDLDSFLSSQGDITADPNFLEHVLQWGASRSQYDLDKAKALNQHLVQNGGVVSPTWEPNYNLQHGYGPVFNRSNGNLDQPGQPSAPAAQQTQQPSFSHTATASDGRRVGWDGKQWVPIK